MASNKSEAEEYDRLMDSVKGQLPKDLNILNRIQSLEGKVILDLGCGTGNYTYMIAERVGPTGRVTGVDPDRERIKIAREKWSRDNLTFLEGDDQSFPEDQYDIIFSHYAIHWIENKRQMFTRVYKNLRPGGQCAFIATHGHNPIGSEMSALMGPEGHKAINDQWHYTVSADDYRELASGAHFTVTLIEEDTDDYTFPDVDTLISSWHGITDGKFDASKANQAGLEMFKIKYGGKPIKFHQPVIRIILEKK